MIATTAAATGNKHPMRVAEILVSAVASAATAKARPIQIAITSGLLPLEPCRLPEAALRRQWVESGHSVWHHSLMLFTPKKHGKDYTRFSGLAFCAGACVFAFFAIIAPWSGYDSLWDTIFAMLAFILGAIVFGALGKDLLAKASEMSDDHRRR